MSTPFRTEHLARIVALSRAGYPNESCGVIVGKSWDDARLVELENVYDKYAKVDPETYPRTSRTAYLMHPLKLQRAIDDAGGLLCIWHSHCDVGAYFSAEDVRAATSNGGEPIHPGAKYLVVSCRAEGVDVMKAFTWEPAARAYSEEAVAVP